jgi:hypothetical protein
MIFCIWIVGYGEDFDGRNQNWENFGNRTDTITIDVYDGYDALEFGKCIWSFGIQSQ